ncbi:Uncharacterised protein [Klebsiella variicola]|nr:Uncharacterised protein [Klebsiella variicola]
MVVHRRPGPRGQERHQHLHAFPGSPRQHHHRQQRQKSRQRRCGNGGTSRYAQPRQAQQILRGVVRATRPKGCRVGIFAPDTVILGDQPMVKDIEKILGRLDAFPPLRNVIAIVGRQRGFHAVESHKSNAHRRRTGRFRIVHSTDFASRKAHPRMRAKAYGFIT